MSALLALAAQAGLPFLKSILSRKLGDAGGRLAGAVVDKIAAQAGVPDAAGLEALVATTPGRVIEAMKAVEMEGPDMVGVYLEEAETRAAMLAAEEDEPLWVRAWRPLGMYGLGFLWIWNIVLLHLANAIFKIALPPVDFNILIQISGLYMGLYMGGHTVKDLAATWKAKA